MNNTQSNKTYRVSKFDTQRTMHSEHASFAAAASALRKLSADWFIQGPRSAWFYDDVRHMSEFAPGPESGHNWYPDSYKESR